MDTVRGVVKFFDDAKGYGFIYAEDGEDIFVHYKAIVGNGFRSVAQGDRVEFSILDTPKGRKAEHVIVTEEASGPQDDPLRWKPPVGWKPPEAERPTAEPKPKPRDDEKTPESDRHGIPISTRKSPWTAMPSNSSILPKN